jgi:ParB/RepB/Spo0J family partition protein
MATAAQAQQVRMQLDRIHVPGNVRSLDVEHVQALAGSIGLQGILVPVVVSPATDEVAAGGWEVELVAGFHRVAAAAQLGLTEIPVVVRLGGTVDSDRAIENIARKNLRADDEARAVKAMLDRGLSEDGAAQALGWPRQRVTARMKLLGLPDRACELVGAGVIALSTVDELRKIGEVSPQLLDVLIEFVDDADDRWPARQLSSQPGRVLAEALRHTNSKVFAAYLLWRFFWSAGINRHGDRR